MTLVDTVFFNNATGQPEPLSLSFDVTNGAPVIVFAEIQVDGLNGVADLGDPPTLSLNLPKGASVTTASGVFDNFTSAPIPEPSTWAMLLIGFAGLGFAGRRSSRRTAAAAGGTFHFAVAVLQQRMCHEAKLGFPAKLAKRPSPMRSATRSSAPTGVAMP